MRDITPTNVYKDGTTTYKSKTLERRLDTVNHTPYSVGFNKAYLLMLTKKGNRCCCFLRFFCYQEYFLHYHGNTSLVEKTRIVSSFKRSDPYRQEVRVSIRLVPEVAHALDEQNGQS